ncbi:hypothetical protein CORC01_10902 [Colletotrichum orchidophilum]|uniref:Uncharacterized protein n=1 Tax=Colletotrichum orchidophilum TaxID=1209926 RepID=A0A1G4AXD2_9PEZI|nr:uncharacterized protein CORC01_10902 [Colletotrichum orchidophilum]OHE93776.1 hypothetical protein CORC01_10902 [Colletotrichum orchidophilum]
METPPIEVSSIPIGGEPSSAHNTTTDVDSDTEAMAQYFTDLIDVFTSSFSSPTANGKVLMDHIIRAHGYRQRRGVTKGDSVL